MKNLMSHIRKEFNDKNNFIQIFIVFSLLYSFIGTSIYYTGLFTGSYRRKLTIFVLTTILFAFFVYIFLKKFKSKSNKFYSIAKKYKFLIAILLVSVLIRLPQIGTPVRWDSEVYYEGLMSMCDTFDFTIQSLLESGRLADHPAFSYAFLSAIFEFLFPKSMVSVQIFQLLLSLITIFVIYKILEKLSDESEFSIALSTLLFSCSPMFLGTGSYYHLDFGIAVFLFFLLGAHIYEKYILFFLSALLLVFTKEVGIVILFGYFCFYCLIRIMREEGKIKCRIVQLFKDPAVCIMTVSGILGAICLVYFIFIKQSGWGTVEIVKDTSGNLRATDEMLGFFAIQKDYILFKIKQFLTTNFIWLSIMLIFSLSTVCIVIKKMRFFFKAELCGMIGGLSLFYLFSCLYVTYPLLRYNLLIEMIINFFLVITILQIPNKKIVIILESLLIALFFTQAYISIDPVMKSVNQKVETGGVPLYLSNEETTDYFGDYMIYNYQYSFVDRGLKKVFTEVRYNNEMNVILPGESRALSIGGDLRHIYDKLLWDEKRNCFTYKENSYCSDFSIVQANEVRNYFEEEGLKEKAVIIYIPYYKADKTATEKELQKYYEIIETGKIEVGMYGYMEYTCLELK